MKTILVGLVVWALAFGVAMGQEDGGPPVGTKLDTNADGIWDHTLLENGEWDPPLTSMPPPGTLVDFNSDNVADAVLVDQNGNGIIDGIDIGMDGTVDNQIEEGGGGGGGGGGPQPGTQLDTNADGIWDHTLLENGEWDPPLTGMPPPGTLVDLNGDNAADAVLVDQNGNGIIDGIDIGMDGTVDNQIEEGGGGGGGGGQELPEGTRLDTDGDGTWDYTYLGDGLGWDPPLYEMPPPGTLVDFNSDNAADAVLVDQNGNGKSDGIDIGMDGTVDMSFAETEGAGGPPVGTRLDTDGDGTWDHTYLGDGLGWDPPLSQMPPVGTLVDFDADGVADAVLVDVNGDGIADAVDIGMDGSPDSYL